MPNIDHKGWHYRGYLPHFDSPEMIQHIVIRTLNSLPAHILDTLPSEPQKRRRTAGAVLDELQFDTRLGNPAIAEIVTSVLGHFDRERYRLLAWCIMPNHVHVAIEQMDGWSLGSVIRSWKTFSTRQINALQHSSGQVWALDYFDRYIRNQEQLVQVVNYIENNPVKAGIVDTPEDWPFSSASLRR